MMLTGCTTIKIARIRYYFKIRVLLVKLISCLPESNKGMDKDFLIILGEWHHGLHCLTRDGELGGMFIGSRKLFYL